MEKILRERDIDNELMKALMEDTPSYEKLTKLLKAGADINSLSNKKKHNCIMDILYSVQSEINEKYNPQPELIKFMIDNGADLNYCDDEGFSVVHCCEFANNSDEILDILIKNGANPNFVCESDEGTILDASEARLGLTVDYKLKMEKYGLKRRYELKAAKVDKYLIYTSFFGNSFLTLTGYLDPFCFNCINEQNIKFVTDNINRFKDWKIKIQSSELEEIFNLHYELFKLIKLIKNEIGNNIVFKFYYLEFYSDGTINYRIFQPDQWEYFDIMLKHQSFNRVMQRIHLDDNSSFEI